MNFFIIAYCAAPLPRPPSNFTCSHHFIFLSTTESRPLCESRRYPGEPCHHAGHGQDRESGVRLHSRGPDCLIQADCRAGRAAGKWQWWNQCHVSFIYLFKHVHLPAPPHTHLKKCVFGVLFGVFVCLLGAYECFSGCMPLWKKLQPLGKETGSEDRNMDNQINKNQRTEKYDHNTENPIKTDDRIIIYLIFHS